MALFRLWMTAAREARAQALIRAQALTLAALALVAALTETKMAVATTSS